MEQDGVALIAAERRRQVEEEGYTAEHDAGKADELIAAGVAYAMHAYDPEHEDGPEWWPWALEYWKPTGDRVRDLTKAASLFAAAIDAELRSRVVAS